MSQIWHDFWTETKLSQNKQAILWSFSFVHLTFGLFVFSHHFSPLCVFWPCIYHMDFHITGPVSHFKRKECILINTQLFLLITFSLLNVTAKPLTHSLIREEAAKAQGAVLPPLSSWHGCLFRSGKAKRRRCNGMENEKP